MTSRMERTHQEARGDSARRVAAWKAGGGYEGELFRRRAMRPYLDGDRCTLRAIAMPTAAKGHMPW